MSWFALSSVVVFFASQCWALVLVWCLFCVYVILWEIIALQRFVNIQMNSMNFMGQTMEKPNERSIHGTLSILNNHNTVFSGIVLEFFHFLNITADDSMAKTSRGKRRRTKKQKKNSQDVGNRIFTNQSDENDEKYLLVISLKPGIATQYKKIPTWKNIALSLSLALCRNRTLRFV